MDDAEKTDFLRLDRDAAGDVILAGLTVEESKEFIFYAVNIARWAERYKELTAKHDAALKLREKHTENVTIFNPQRKAN